MAPEALEVDEKPPEPEPVEVQIEASLASDAKGKPEDVFAVVMVRLKRRCISLSFLPCFDGF